MYLFLCVKIREYKSLSPYIKQNGKSGSILRLLMVKTENQSKRMWWWGREEDAKGKMARDMKQSLGSRKLVASSTVM